MQFETFHYPLTILERHLDTFGHVNNAAYLQILEEARWDLITARGFGMYEIIKSGIGPTILECNIRFIKELRLRQDIVIVSQTQSYERKICMMKQSILNETGKICAEAMFTVGLFDTKERKLIPPTPEWLHAIGSIG